VPEDISIIGYDGIAQDSGIALSSVRQNAYDIGKMAVKLVDRMISRVSYTECRVIMPMQFAASESTGPPPKC
jgi:DNA-binding LacI/PurR family transcriptional regulator